MREVVGEGWSWPVAEAGLSSLVGDGGLSFPVRGSWLVVAAASGEFTRAVD